MSQLERELRSKRKAHHKHGGSRTPSRSASKTRVESEDESSSMFDTDTSDLNFSKLDELLKQKIQNENGGDGNNGGTESSLLNVPEVIASPIRRHGSGLVLSREESRANSVIGSIIDSDHEGGSGKSDSGELSDEPGVIKIYSIADVIDALTQSRSKINSISREFLLGELYKMIIKKPLNVPGGVVNESDLASLIGFIKGSRSSLELLLSLRSCVAYSCSDSDEVATVVIDDLFPILLSRIFSNNSADAAASKSTDDNDDSSNSSLVVSNFVIAFFSLTLVMFDGSDCYGLEENIGNFMELCEGFANSNLKENEEDILVNSFYGIGAILSLLHKGGREVNEYIQDILPRLTSFLSNDFSKKIQKSVVVLIGLTYEIYDYPESEDGLDEEDLLDQQPYYDLGELKSMIVSLIKESSKKISKKDKKDSRSIFREVLKTIEKYTTPKSDLDLDNDIKEDDILYRFHLNKAKTLPIKSWFEYIRLIHLKYIFDTQLSLHYVSNSEIRAILMLDKDSRKFDTSFEDDSSSGPTHNWKDKGKNVSGIKKELNIKHARDAKLQEQMHELGLDGEE